jgi:lactoylglutathione lyase
MIRVLDLDKSITFYDQAFHLKIADQFDFDGFTLVYLRNDEADFEIELTMNKDRTEPYSHGDGYGHVAVCVDNCVSEHQHMQELGLKPTDVPEFNRDGELMARFLFLEEPDGYKNEALERHGRYR